MSELIPAGSIESYEVYNLGHSRDACLGNTIASIVSTITGREYHMPAIYYAWRGMMIKDMTRTFANHIRRGVHGDREGLELALHRLDQRVFKTVIKSIRETGIALDSAIPVAAVLEDSEINYRRGDFSAMLEAINNREQVAVTYQTPPSEDPQGETWWHMAHIGFNEDGQFVRLSDGSEPVMQDTIEAINQGASYLNLEARTWNFVTVKPKYL